MKKALVIQTAFIGDVILATSFIETLKKELGNDCVIDVLVRRGNEVLLEGHPKVNQVLVWNKKLVKLINDSKLIIQNIIKDNINKIKNKDFE